MSKSIQLRVPAPCQEHWNDMQPTEKGRHCSSCCKTVVDFTSMSDPDIIRYLARAGANVCGRLAPDQVNRPLLPLAPPQRNGWSGWRYLLAGALVISRGQGSHPAAKATIGKVAVASDTSRVGDVRMGGIAISGPECHEVADSVQAPEVRMVEEVDTGHLMGDMAVMIIDSTAKDSLAMDSLARPPVMPMADTAARCDRDEGFVGKLAWKRDSVVDSVKRVVTGIVADTLTALRLLPKTESGWTMYPNPVMRGAALHFSGQTVSGTYYISLFSAGGTLIQERVLESGGPGQVDSWEIPARLAAGVYFIRVVRPGQGGAWPGQGGGWTQEVVVE